MLKPKTPPAALYWKAMSICGLFTTFMVVGDPMTAFAFTLVAYVVMATV
jgi:hypothetical protein